MLLRGVERITGPHAGNHVLTEGGLDLWDGTRPARLEVVEPFAKRTLIFSRRVVLGACPRLADVAAVPDLGRLPGARLLARYADAVVTELPGMDARMRATACDVALELLRSLVEPALPDTRAARRRPSVHAPGATSGSTWPIRGSVPMPSRGHCRSRCAPSTPRSKGAVRPSRRWCAGAGWRAAVRTWPTRRAAR